MSKYLVSSVLFTFILISNACSTDDNGGSTPTATVTSFPETGLLGKEITIGIENMPGGGHLQVFFDLEEAQIQYISDDEIQVIVPRSLTNNTPTIKIIDQAVHETILEEVFHLKTPLISHYSASEAIFGQPVIIYGDNFDEELDDVSVLINNKPAQILATAYNQIEVLLPEELLNSNLEVKVIAQRQEVSSTVPLTMTAPIITNVENAVAWIGGELIVNGFNFNPNYEFGEVTINGLPCHFSIYANTLQVSIPPGPYTDFQITNVTYKTAGQVVSHNVNIPIGNDGIMVDYNNYTSMHTIFVHNNKAYNIVSMGSPFSASSEYRILEFSPVTEKWTMLSSFQHTGAITDAVYDGSENLFLYNRVGETATYQLSKMNLNTFSIQNVSLPDNGIINPILFAYQNTLYLLSGLDYNNGYLSTRTQKYSFSISSNAWTVLPSTMFSDLPLVSPQGSGKCKYMHFNNNIYLSYGINFKTYKITSGLSTTQYQFDFSFGYQNSVIGRYGNSSTQTLYNIETNAYQNMQQDIFGLSNTFFTLNNKIYYFRLGFGGYHLNSTFTNRLRTSSINGIL